MENWIKEKTWSFVPAISRKLVIQVIVAVMHEEQRH